MKKYCIFSTHHVKFFLKKLDRGETNAILKHSTAQHSTAQHSTAQHSTAQHSTAQHVNLNIRAYLSYIKIKIASKIDVFVPQRCLFLVAKREEVA
ncbi:hypothetical protein ACTMEC_00120 (plasmid) [Enterococcus faecalis]|uniref:hypothetical protein n=1 Tax=Enterococcus faecalis TaxID=1351 RepID=UPI003F939B26